jgi:hypothetical protein
MARRHPIPYATASSSHRLHSLLHPTGLGGDCRTSVIVCGSMDSANANETVASMRFGLCLLLCVVCHVLCAVCCLLCVISCVLKHVDQFESLRSLLNSTPSSHLS